MKKIRRKDKAEGFKLQPLRWVVERTYDWLTQERRLVVDRETKTCSFEAMIKLMTRRLANQSFLDSHLDL